MGCVGAAEGVARVSTQPAVPFAAIGATLEAVVLPVVAAAAVVVAVTAAVIPAVCELWTLGVIGRCRPVLEASVEQSWRHVCEASARTGQRAPAQSWPPEHGRVPSQGDAPHACSASDAPSFRAWIGGGRAHPRGEHTDHAGARPGHLAAVSCRVLPRRALPSEVWRTCCRCVGVPNVALRPDEYRYYIHVCTLLKSLLQYCNSAITLGHSLYC